MSLHEVAWLALGAYALHIMEEYTLDWRGWARGVIGLPVEWGEFYVTNAVVVVLGIVQAELAQAMPLAPLTFAALMLIDAVFFHVLPMLRTRGRFSPGTGTAVLLFFPVVALAFFTAHAEDELSFAAGLAAVGAGAVLMAFPVLLLRLKSQPYFRQV